MDVGITLGDFLGIVMALVVTVKNRIVNVRKSKKKNYRLSTLFCSTKKKGGRGAGQPLYRLSGFNFALN